MSKHKPQPTQTPNTPPLAEEAPAEKPLNAEAATETLLSAITQRLDGVKQDGETSLQTLERVIREHGDMAAALQPAFDTLGAKANTRGILMSHVAGSGPDYDTGGQYMVTLVSVEDGAVRLSPLVDLGPKGTPSPVMSFGVAADHVLKRLEDFLRPKAHRS